jgi:FkbM family methyltransferase
MNLRKHRQNFIDNRITKADYIKTMYLEHHLHLFDYKDYISNTDIKKIEITEDGVLFTSREYEIKMLCLEGDYRLAPIEILNFLEYEPNETNMMLNLIPKGANIYDIGANAGWFSILFAKRDLSSSVFAFEPIPRTYELLKTNIALNKSENIQMFNYGLSDKTQDLDFYYFQEGSGNASAINVSENKSAERINCHVKSLDSCMKDISDSVDFIKCDVEGAELLVFKGALASIERNKPIIFAEMLRKWAAKYDYHPNEIIKLLNKKGYLCFVVDGTKLKSLEEMDDNTIETNYFFLHKSKHAVEIKKYLAQ